MCTVTYLPIGPSGFILTHSRDEKATRPAALSPATVQVGGQDVTFPQDPQGQGTWIASSDGLTACLLNGAFVPHQPRPLYKHSRGLVVLDVFDYVSVNAFIARYSFQDLEPFTLILAETGRPPGQRLTELRWNGNRLFINDKADRQPHIWSSVTLYTAEVIRQREQWFVQWMEQVDYWSTAGIRTFHKTAGDGDVRNALRMNRPHYFTVSLTSVLHTGRQSAMLYEDLLPTQSGSYPKLTYPYAAA